MKCLLFSLNPYVYFKNNHPTDFLGATRGLHKAQHTLGRIIFLMLMFEVDTDDFVWHLSNAAEMAHAQ